MLSAVLMASVVGVVAPAVAAANEQAACVWTAAILPLPTSALNGEVTATDNVGGYAGTVSYGATKGVNAALWKNGKVTDYGRLTDPAYQNWVSIEGVNAAGTVVGSAFRESDGFPNAIRSRNGKMERLPELAGADASQAMGINDNGDIIGAVETIVGGSPHWNAVIWPASQPGTVQKLAGLPSSEAFATGIDQDGTVLVEVEDGNFNRVPYLWKAGTARKLAFPGDGYDVVTRGISNGRVIGIVSYESGDWGGALWDRNGKATAVPRGDDIWDINRNGQIVGRTDDPSWEEFGVWQLTTLSGTLRYSTDRGLEVHVSSDDGTIAGRSWKFGGGQDEPTVWTCR